ncbi:DUF721 domain-containing protein (plasmid) [Streptomyces sp. NBC_00963]|uniref:DUF721 domain-containing protein n=1 Tax=Streptomyces sp. NBC_00963 TaxID=2903697 RepID=UPI002F919503|nr:DUF721 domain-containing protein [Streptomyces sp. NBC_00963]
MTTEMDTPPEHPRVDLARVSLRAAQEAARRNGGVTESRTPQSQLRHLRHSVDGREPTGFGSILECLIDDRAWTAPIAGGNAARLWPTIAGKQLASHVRVVGFRTGHQELVVEADSPAWLTQLRLERPTLLQRFREALDSDVVLDIVRISSDRTVTVPPALDIEATEPKAPIITQENSSAGYRRAREAYLATRAASIEGGSSRTALA